MDTRMAAPTGGDNTDMIRQFLAGVGATGFNSQGQPVDPSTGRPPSNVSQAEGRARTHVAFPDVRQTPPVRQSLPTRAIATIVGILLYAFGIVAPAPAN